MLYALKQASNKFSCGQDVLMPYSKSSHKAIQASADNAASVLELLAEIQNKRVQEIRAHLDALAAGKAKPGSFLERQAELTSTQNDVWKSLIDAAMLASFAIPAEDPKTGLMSRSTLTTAQHQRLLKELKSGFGDSVTHGIQVGQPAYLGAAAILYQVLADPKRVTSNQ
jgi:hypothetical protein